jgi:hypothetical protein
MDIDGNLPAISPLSRRAMLGTLGAGAVGLTAAMALPTVAVAAPIGEGPAEGGGQDGGPSPAALEVASLGATPVNEVLDYVFVSGWEIQPLTSTQKWVRFDNSFQFSGTAPGDQGWALIPMYLTVGAVVKEIELYGFTAAGSSSALELWTSSGLNPGASKTTNVAIPVNAGAFTVTMAADVTVSTTGAARAFVNITDTAAGATKITGARIGYVPLLAPPVPVSTPPAFVALNPIPRPYNTRDTPGLTKLADGEERTIQLPVPAGISAAVVQLTVTETGPGGWVAVFSGDAPSWPGNSSINWSGVNSSVGNTVLTAVSPDGKIKIRGGQSSTHVIIDVPGVIY